MAHQIKAWLGTHVEREIEDVVAWKTKVKPEPGVPQAIEAERFWDDGSNYHSTVNLAHLGAAAEVQILQVSDADSRVNQFIVSDGETRIYATLALAAWRTYESELEDGEAPSKGDLLICKEITVISTHIGPSDERVRIRIEQVEFEGVNFRKTIGNPVPIERRPEIQRLIGEVTQVRNAKDKASNRDDEAISNEEAESEGSFRSQASQALPQSGILVQSQLHTTSQAPVQERRPTDFTNFRKRKLQSLEASGLELAHGVNNAPPQAPTLSSKNRDRTRGERAGKDRMKHRKGLPGMASQAVARPASRPADNSANPESVEQKSVTPKFVTSPSGPKSVQARPKAASEIVKNPHKFSTTIQQPLQKSVETIDLIEESGLQSTIGARSDLKALLDVRPFERRQGAPGSDSSPDPLQTPTIIETQISNTRKRPSSLLDSDKARNPYGANGTVPQPRIVSNKDGPAPGEKRNPTTAIAHHRGLPEGSVPISAQMPRENMVLETPVKPQRSITDATTTKAGVSGQSKSQQSSTKSTPSLRAPVRQPKRHVIPDIQKELLGRKSSWLPSLPGQQFPHPNIPIELLQSWNSNAATMNRLPSQAPLAIEASSDNQRPEEASLTSEAGPGAESTRDDEPLQWSQSPSQRLRLPADSSAVQLFARHDESQHTTPSATPVRPPPGRGSLSVSVTPIHGRHSMSNAATPIQSSARLPPNSRPTSSSYTPVQAGRTAHQQAFHALVPRISRVTDQKTNLEKSQDQDSRLNLSNRERERSHGRASPKSRAQEPRLTPNGSPRSLLAMSNNVRTPTPPSMPTEGSPNRQTGSVQPEHRPSASFTRPTLLEGSKLVPFHPSLSRVPSGSFNSPTGPRNLQQQRQQRYELPSSKEFEQLPIHSTSVTKSPQIGLTANDSPSSRSRSLFMYNNEQIRNQGVASRPASKASTNRAQSTARPSQISRNDDGPRVSSQASNDRIASGPRNSQPTRHDRDTRPRPRGRSFKGRGGYTPKIDIYRPTYDQESRAPNHDPPIQRSQQFDSSGELEMSVPRALEAQRPYREQRSEYFRGASRRQWIAKNVTVEDLPDLDMPALLQQYRKAHPQDPATTDDLLHAICTAYPEHESQAVPRLAPVKSQTLPDMTRDTPLPQRRSIELRKLVESASTNGGGTIDVLSQQMSGETMQTANSREWQPSNVYREYAYACKNLNPGGANFYKMKPRGEVRPKAPRRGLNVLGWGFGV